MSHRYDEILDNAMLQPTVFAKKSPSSAEQWYHSIGREGLRIVHGLEKVHY